MWCLILGLFFLFFKLPVIAATYNPNSETLLNGTLSVSGDTSALVSDDNSYRVIRSYPSSFTADYQTTNVDVATSYAASTTYQDKATLTWTVPTADTYLIIATAEIKRSSTTALRSTKAQLLIDGNGSGEQHVTDDTDVDIFRSFSVVKIVNLSAASHTIKIQYGTANTLNTATIRNARITAYRIGSQYQASEPANSTTTSTSYTDIATLSFTPERTEDWLIIGQAEVTQSSTSNLSYVNLMVGDSQVAENVTRTAYATYYLPATAWEHVSLTAGVGVTIKTQMKASAGTTTYRNVRLYAIPESIYSEFYQAQKSIGTSCSTCTSAAPVTVSTLNFTPDSSGDFLIVANGEIKTNSATVYVRAHVGVGSSLGTAIVDVGNTAHYASFSIHKIVNLPASAQSVNVYLSTQTSGTLVTMRNVTIVAIKLPTASKQTLEVEYGGIGDTDAWTSLTWNLAAAFSKASVGTTVQLYNYNSSAYPSFGNGFLSYTSNGTANTEDLKTQTISTNPTYFRNSSGNWKMKISSSYDSTDWFQFSGDLLEYISYFPVVSLSITDGTVNFGTLGVGGSRWTLISGTNDTQYVKNEGTSTQGFNIKGQNTACPWTLASSPGTDIYSQFFSTNSGVGWTALTTSYSSLISNISTGNTFPLDLFFKSPTSTNCTSIQSVDVTIQAFQL